MRRAEAPHALHGRGPKLLSMDFVSIAIALVAFVAFYVAIDGLDRI